MLKNVLTVAAFAAVTSFAAVASADTIHINENFDSVGAPALPTGWTDSGSGALAPWSTVTSDANSLPNSVFTNDVASVSSRFLTMPSFIADGTVTLSLYSNFVTEANFDGWVVEAEINGGGFANIGDAAWILNGYNSTISVSFGSEIGGQRAFSGSERLWTNRVANIAANPNDQVTLRFRMATDSSVSSTGVWLDDVLVTSVPAPGAVALLALGGLVSTRRRRA